MASPLGKALATAPDWIDEALATPAVKAQPSVKPKPKPATVPVPSQLDSSPVSLCMDGDSSQSKSAGGFSLSQGPYFPLLGRLPDVEKVEAEVNSAPHELWTHWQEPSWQETNMYKEINKMKSWVQQVVVAWLGNDGIRLGALISAAKSWPSVPRATTMAISGAGRLLNSSFVWSSLQAHKGSQREELIRRWKKAVSSDPRATRVAQFKVDPFAGCDLPEFEKMIRRMDLAVQSVEENPLPGESWRLRLAITLVGSGFTDASLLGGMDDSSVDFYTFGDPRAKGYLQKLRDKVYFQAHEGRACKLRKLYNFQAGSVAEKKLDTVAFLDSLTPAAIEAADERVERSLQTMHLELHKPAAAAAGVKEAALRGQDAKSVLLQRVHQLRLETDRKSMASVSSGLKCWHVFALALGYPQEESLPPRSGEDAWAFIGIFKVHGTARNYLGFVKWACLTNGLPMDWFTEEVSQALKGLRKQNQRVLLGQLRDKFKLDDKLLLALVRMAGAFGLHQHRVAFTLGWQYLFRMQSECVPLEKGSATTVVDLPEGRHSAVWLAPNRQLHVRLKSRKNRPGGSLLVRACTCHLEDSSVCAVCSVEEYIETKLEGERLFSFTAGELLGQLRRLLTLLQVLGAAQFGFKSFRAGKATTMALSGIALPDVMRAGEWSSAACLAYAGSDDCDHGAMFKHAIDNDVD